MPAGGLQLNVSEGSTLIYPEGGSLVSSSSGHVYFETLDDLNQTNHLWDVDYHKFEFNGTITSKIMIDNHKMGSPKDLLSVFVDGECRGIARAQKSPFADEYVFLLMAYSNKISGEKMTFSYYDAVNDIVYNDIKDMSFEADMIQGDAINSFTINYKTEATPSGYKLGAAYPNPFNPTTNIEYSVLEEGYANISVYDLQGRVIKELVNEYKDQGNYEIVWNAINIPSGVYFIQMNINSFVSTQKVMLVK
tara:strand:- start:57 stop:803 length:747 start_codon:yes stop_codon:yes gene_type:complete